MAVTKVPSGSALRMRLQTGVDGEGNPVYRTKSLNNVKADALDQDIYDVSQAVSGLQEYTLVSVERVDNAELVDEGV
ncbi:DUF1659 domain-containing protein [Desulfolucanica intricata]|uniref:DUF1659 domain-containing protein n=1 Tax=Desulfolucanica intricata TaxID=1285191 RepID=UPI00082D3212|nr:DUF1659 domain-containing protein [Desulfolucanica intricata]